MRKIVVVSHPSDWHLQIPGVEIVSVKAYLTDPLYHDLKNVRIFNLSRNYWYQSAGYYVSLLAEARGHKVIPNVTTIQDLKSNTIVRALSDDLDDLIQQKLSKIKADRFTLSIYFGKNLTARYNELSQKIYGLFRAPLLRAQFTFRQKWVLQSVTLISMKEIPETHFPYIQLFAEQYFNKKRHINSQPFKANFDLAILVNPEELSPPSDKKALQQFVEAGERMGFEVDLITKADYDHLAEYDALFIRETTAVNHHTYRFARTALAEGIAVLDDPISILRCSNKVYLAEALEKANIPTPKTVIVHKENKEVLAQLIGFPIVLKKPDSSFSQGVMKVQNEEDLKKALDQLLEDSDLVIAQEFLPTTFDWRIGILDKKPIFACKYYMAKDHWQIYDWSKKDSCGTFETFALDQVPKSILDLAIKASSLMGSGLYGVDLKESGGKVYVIEINDNPSIDAGIEDRVAGVSLYDTIMTRLRKDIEKTIPPL
ncbi:MAG: RimK domain-containing protein ATP-grasp [Candidatus Uhrbacteria bacterium GW2011_GWF2_39_13]|uniref:RimK domain-containing protein ATP-grasp n=1 Tax=Candidatus Uhrbacteria bacterium GW2011_GWF2_39_13 TaxID=1618995 RepID=A0A0G0MXB1_9BACT|nr:MAG: RimK domain-containing protein ATP-grasp [Candidatus Uhrbacteria bacterium GW2011_GWF2_39_13]HAU66376.1 RimK family alpha-L-glutamate ligase [Candidatus Uhrbacteria bacterium]